MRRLRGLYGCCLALVLLWSTAGLTLAAEPEKPAQVVMRLTQAIGSMQPMAAPTNQAVAWQTPTAMLDITGVSQRALGKHWQTCTPAQKQQFVTLFTKLLENVAFRKTAPFFRTLDVAVTNERVTGPQAVVSTTMSHPKEGHISIDYLLTRYHQTWRVRDVILDDVSLVMNLRSQFHKIITEFSWEELLRRMREKLTVAPAFAATQR
jgi:phospholipid transport system substrate-binding protein